MSREWPEVTAEVCATGFVRAEVDSLDSFRLNEPEVYSILAGMGLHTCRHTVLKMESSDAERTSWAEQAVLLADGAGRVLLKVVGRNILHKSDVGGVRVFHVSSDSGPKDLLAAVDDILAKAKGAGVSEMCEGVMACAFVDHVPNQPGQEILLSLRQDPAFGPVVVVGIGGLLTEWYGSGTGGRSRLIFPAAGLRKETVVSALTGHPLLKILCTSSRLYADPQIDVLVLAEAVQALAEIGLYYGPGSDTEWTLEEIEINPAVISGGQLVAIDGVGLVSRRLWPAADRPLAKIVPLLEPRSAVVMGVSAKGMNPGRIILTNLQHSEGIDSKRLWVIHPGESEIAGVPCFSELANLPEKADLAVVAIPAGGARDAISEIIAADAAESIILIPGGFAETGDTDIADAIERDLAAGHLQKGGGPVMVGGNCLGIVSRNQYNTFFLPRYKLPFRPGLGENLALVSQSGAYLVTFASNYDGIIFPKASISFGNQMDLTVADFLAHFLGDDEVDVVACYVEGFRPGDGARFLNYARQARDAGKKVVVFKAGKTERGARAAASHTASLAGDYDVAKSCLEDAGVTVAESLDDFEDLLKTFCLLSRKRLRGRRVGIISNAGFECSTVMDQIDELELAVFDESARAVIDAVLPAYAHRSNPIDATPIADTAAYAESTRAILECVNVDLAIISSVPVTPALNNLVADPDGRHSEDLKSPESQPSLLLPLLQKSDKPTVVVVDSGTIYDPMVVMIEKGGIPVFRKVDRAARALCAFCRASEIS